MIRDYRRFLFLQVLKMNDPKRLNLCDRLKEVNAAEI
jgi:hypothetical protein